jgi:JNK_SAPK-associated protein-1
MPSEAMEAVDALASVVDVYDLASEIGKEFERLIDAHGADSLTNMMPKVRFLNDSTSGHFNCDTEEHNCIFKYYALVCQIGKQTITYPAERLCTNLNYKFHATKSTPSRNPQGHPRPIYSHGEASALSMSI